MENTRPTQREKLLELDYNPNLLSNAIVAAEYLQEGENGMPFAKKSLELILEDAGIKDSWIVKTVTDPEVLKKTIENQLETYQRYKGNQTIGNLLDNYNNDISRYLGGNAEVALKELSRFKKERYSDIVKKIKELDYVIKGKEFGKSSDKEVETAKKAMEKYQKISLTFNLFEKLRSGKFRIRVEEEAAKDGLKELYKPNESEKYIGKTNQAIH